MCVEWKECDSLQASCISAKIKQMFLVWILIQIMGDVIKNRRAGTLWNRNGAKNTNGNTFALYANVSIFNMIHLWRSYGPSTHCFPTKGTLYNLKIIPLILESLQFCYRDKIWSHIIMKNKIKVNNYYFMFTADKC